MKISIDELKALPQQRASFSFNEKVDGLDAIKPVLGDLTIVYSATGILLFGRVKTLLKLQCDSCLRPFFQAMTVDIDERFVPPSMFPEEVEKERELHSSDFVEPLPADGVLDISDVVYQAVTLATPSCVRCGEECPGPPGQESGAQTKAGTGETGSVTSGLYGKPLDPRWKNLKTLLPNDDSKENS